MTERGVHEGRSPGMESIAIELLRSTPAGWRPCWRFRRVCAAAAALTCAASPGTRAPFATSTRRWRRTHERRAGVSRRRVAPRQLPRHHGDRSRYSSRPATSFYRKLPTTTAEEFAGEPRVYAMALELIRCSAGRLDPQRLHRFVTAFQAVTPLTMGAVAWPSALKLAIVQHLRTRADVMATNRTHRRNADQLVNAISLESPVPKALPSSAPPAFVIRLLQRAREHGAAAAALRQRIEAALPRPDRQSRTRSALTGVIRPPNRRRWRT